jgi:hypothetical protein
VNFRPFLADACNSDGTQKKRWKRVVRGKKWLVKVSLLYRTNDARWPKVSKQAIISRSTMGTIFSSTKGIIFSSIAVAPQVLPILVWEDEDPVLDQNHVEVQEGVLDEEAGFNVVKNDYQQHCQVCEAKHLRLIGSSWKVTWNSRSNWLLLSIITDLVESPPVEFDNIVVRDVEWWKFIALAKYAKSSKHYFLVFLGIIIIISGALGKGRKRLFEKKNWLDVSVWSMPLHGNASIHYFV